MVKTLYSVHPGVALVQDWIESLPEKTGRSLKQWLAFIKREGPPSEEERRAWLKKEHGLGTNAAWWLAERAAGKGEEDGDPKLYLEAAERYVEQMFSGARAKLRPLYDRLLSLGLAAGKDARACPCKTIVPLYREHVFAQIKPASNTRIDMGFSLGDRKAKGRLIDTGGFTKGDRITHRIPIASIDDIDGEVERWLETAYAMDAPRPKGPKAAAKKKR